MFLTTVALQWARTLIDAFLAALSARPAAALLVTPKIRLFSGVEVPLADSTVGVFTTALFSGYADQALTVTAPANTGPNTQSAIGTVTFTATAATPFVSDVITGYIVFDGTSAYYGGERFSEPVPFARAGDFLTLNVALPIGMINDIQD